MLMIVKNHILNRPKVTPLADVERSSKPSTCGKWNPMRFYEFTMHLRRTSRIAGFLVGALLVFLAAGCATTDTFPTGNPPNVRLGPLMTLLKAYTPLHNGVKVVPDSGGRAHVLVSVTELKQVIAITVGPDGVVDRQIIRSGTVPSTIDGAFDARGRLHVLLDDEHVYLEDGVWHNAAPTPWSKAGIKVSQPAFVRGAPDLVWKFEASGKDIGAASGHWSPVLIGGGMGALIIPMYFQTPKVILVAETSAGYGPWNVLNPESTKEARLFDLAADKKGNVHLLFHMSGDFQISYGVTNAQSLEFTGVNSSAPTRDQGTSSSYIGIPTAQKWPAELNLSEMQHLAIEAESGSIFLWPLWLVRSDHQIKVAKRGPFRVLNFLVGAGGASFHAIGWSESTDKILYAMYSDSEWSAPIVLGVGPAWKNKWMSMASTDEGKAMVIWQSEDGIVGQWIERIR